MALHKPVYLKYIAKSMTGKYIRLHDHIENFLDFKNKALTFNLYFLHQEYIDKKNLVNGIPVFNGPHKSEQVSTNHEDFNKLLQHCVKDFVSKMSKDYNFSEVFCDFSSNVSVIFTIIFESEDDLTFYKISKPDYDNYAYTSSTVYINIDMEDR